MRFRTLVPFFLSFSVGCGETAPPTAGPNPNPNPSPAASNAGPGARKIKIAAVLPMFSHPFFIAQKQGLEDKAKTLGVEIDVRDGQDDDLKQINQVETLLNIGCDILILCPRDEEALIPAVEAANRANVPVVTLNRRVNGGKVVTYVGADDAGGGRVQGAALLEFLGSKGGKIIYLQGSQGSSPQRKRQAGLLSVIKDRPEITIADDRFAGFQEDKAKAVMTDLVRRHEPGAIRAIVAQADEMALPASEVARAEGWKDVAVFGFNGMTAAFEAVRSGALHATVLQDPVEQGMKAVETAVDHLNGKTAPAEVITPLRLVTKKNVDQLKPAY